MKNIIFTLVLLFSVRFYTAQTTLTAAVDFTVTDTGGNTINLFSLLNSGKYVCLDFFFVTCVPCQVTSPYFKQTCSNYGCNTQDVFFMSVDYSNTNTQVLSYEQTYLNGNAGYPEISGIEGGGNSVNSIYGISQYPTFILIAPNHQIIETDMWPINSAADFTTYFNNHALNQKSCLVTSINKNILPEDFIFYPNPAKNEVNLTFNEIEKQTITLTDLLGKELMQKETESSSYKLNITDINSGIYFLSVKNASGEKLKKIIIN